MNPLIKRKILDDRLYDWGVPDFKTTGSAGIDLKACIKEPITLPPLVLEKITNPVPIGLTPEYQYESNGSILIGTGLAFDMSESDLAGYIYPRSGLGHKTGIILGNGTGVIDADYQGEIKISVWNRSNKPYTINPGDRIAQIVFQPIIRPLFEDVQEFQSTDRGEGGFGSTGR